MRYWDVFHAARLEAERSLTTEAVRQAIAVGDLLPDDLVRPAGETSWTRIADSTDFTSEPDEAEVELEAEDPFPPDDPSFAAPSIEGEFAIIADDDEPDGPAVSEFELAPDSFASIDRDDLRRAEYGVDEEFEFANDSDAGSGTRSRHTPLPLPDLPSHRQPSSVIAMPILPDEETQRPDLDEYNDPIPDIDFEELDPQDEDDEAAEFTLSRSKAETVEELDLAAMVDVAFQLVLFFLVTAQVVLFKTLEIPKPNEDKPPEAAAQAKAKSIDDLEKDYILVEVDAAGTIKIDRQPVAAQRSVLVEKLRKTREETQRKAMLLSADFATRHEHAVLVFDVANEIELKIAIAQPAAKK